MERDTCNRALISGLTTDTYETNHMQINSETVKQVAEAVSALAAVASLLVARSHRRRYLRGVRAQRMRKYTSRGGSNGARHEPPAPELPGMGPVDPG